MNLRILSVASLLTVAACTGDLRLKVVGVAPESHACELVVTQRGKVISDLAVSGRFSGIGVRVHFPSSYTQHGNSQQ